MRADSSAFKKLLWILPVAIAFCALPTQAGAADMKLETMLVWGTNDGKSPNPKHKPVDDATKKKLKSLPLKWTNFFEETRKTLTVPEAQSKKTSLSDMCEIEVKNLGDSKVEITHIGEGKKVVKQTQSLPKGESIVLGGNAPNATAWLVILKRLE